MRKKLKDVCMFYSGTGFPIQYQGQTKGEYPFYKVGDIANNAIAGKIYLELCNNYISSDVAKMIKGCILPKDTVVFEKIGESLKINRRAITSCDCLIDNNAMGIAPKLDSLRIQYFYFCMKNLKMQTLAESTTVPSVRKTVLEKYEIEVPSLVEQEEIEKKLTLTQKIIEKRRQELSYLDEIIKARFVEMFGDPEQNEKGWRTCRLGDECTVINGRAYKAEELLDEGKYRVLRVGNFFTNDSWYYSDLELDNEKYCDEGDLLFAWSASFGPRIWHGEKVIYHYHIWKLIGYENCLNKDFFVELLNYNCDVMKRGTHGSTMLHFTKSQMEDQLLILPPMQLQEQFADFVHQVDKSKVAVQKALDETQILFDSLMQKYFG